MREWKRRTPPGVRELKLWAVALVATEMSRTPPGVRELKRGVVAHTLPEIGGRTPPGVRELKPPITASYGEPIVVAPLPGCVN